MGRLLGAPLPSRSNANFNGLYLIATALLAMLPLARSQATIAPTDKFYPDPTVTDIQLVFGPYRRPSQRYWLSPLVRDANFTDTRPIEGDFFAVNTTNSNQISRDSVAFISCDESFYSGFYNAASLLSDTIGHNPAAIVLYSERNNGCSYTAAAKINYNRLYSMTQPGNGTMLSLASSSGGHVLIARKNYFDSNQTDVTPANGPGTSNGPTGPSPSTAVAMIILYSITGVITALFLVIIVTGAVRAHRHPERYGPRNALGRPRQSRARGLARAMLDTLPIVKFGENEEEKPQSQDVEMAGGRGKTSVQSGKEPKVAPATGEESKPRDSAPTDESSTNPTEEIQPGEPSDARQSPVPSGSSFRHEAGLGCSICTDDFELGQDVRVLPCDHSFHPACIDPWLLNVSGTCPLCRIDLRPATSHAPDEGVVVAERQQDMFPPPIDPTEHARRGSRRHSLMWDLLNPNRMRDATPQERIDALRQVREERRSSPNEEVEARRRRRLTARLHDVFSIRTTARNRSPEVSASNQPTPNPVLGTVDRISEVPSAGPTTNLEVPAASRGDAELDTTAAPRSR